jgi:hypothetical protein
MTRHHMGEALSLDPVNSAFGMNPAAPDCAISRRTRLAQAVGERVDAA